MKKSGVILVTVTLLLVASFAVLAFRKPGSVPEKKAANSIIGTWQLDSYKYGTSFTRSADLM
jgi:hypothetical protein